MSDVASALWWRLSAAFCGAGTIHQPSIDIFEAFDDLLLMKSGGYITYHGPLGEHSRKLVEYFEVGLPPNVLLAAYINLSLHNQRVCFATLYVEGFLMLRVAAGCAWGAAADRGAQSRHVDAAGKPMSLSCVI